MGPHHVNGDSGRGLRVGGKKAGAVCPLVAAICERREGN